MKASPWGGDDAIVVCLRDAYGVSVNAIERLELGLDAEAAVFRIDAADGNVFFLKLRPGDPVAASIWVPRFLRAAGITQVIAPLPTKTPAPWGVVGAYSAVLYPFVLGRSGFEDGLSLDQWSELGAALGKMHALPVAGEVSQRLRHETFVPTPRWIDAVRAVLAGDHERAQQDEISAPVTAFLAVRRAEIGALLARTEELGRQLRQRPLKRVLCHADIHIGNVLINDDGRLHIVDWDQPVLAPRECDLMLLFGTAIGGFAEGSAEEAAFRAAYGEVEIDPLAMAYYSHERAITDIGAFAHELFWMPDAEAEARRTAARWLETLFESGRSVRRRTKQICASRCAPD